MKYLEWNNCLAEHFFSPAKAGRKVHLFATQELIETIGRSSGDDFENYLESVKGGPPWAHRSGFCQRALEALDGWRDRGLEWPPYIAILALFVIAAGVDEDFPPHAYYPRLRKILGEEPEPRALPSFDKMLALWDDLERWSNLDVEGERGVFRPTLLGNLIYVGVPRAQTLLSEEELHQLPVVFARAGLDPTAIPSEREILSILITSGRDLFRSRTIRTLKSHLEIDADIQRALTEVIIEELRDWTGESFQTDDATAGGIGYQTGTLRLCCDIDRTAGRARMSFRARIPGEFPEQGLSLRIIAPMENGSLDRGPTYICDDWGRGWSSPMEFEGAIVDATDFNWQHPLQFEDLNSNWRLRFAGTQIRIFADGSGEGLPGLVEVRRMPSQSRFYLFAAPADAERLATWGVVSCIEWEELNLPQGLPRNWRGFTAAKALTDEGIRDFYPALALPTNVSIVLLGGIRVTRGNRYFAFAPPSVSVEGAIERLTFNGVETDGQSEAGQFVIPSRVPEIQEIDAGRVLIEAWRGELIVDRRTIYLTRGEWSWTAMHKGVSLTPLGLASEISGEEPSVRGARTSGVIAPEFDFHTAMPIAEHGSVHYVGSLPGQIAHWPSEKVPEEWSPVWVIVSKRRGQVIFCGANISDAEPLSGGASDRKRLKMWKNFLWTRRMQLRPPAHVALRKLWHKYQETARDV